jgi:hypothetical protein
MWAVAYWLIGAVMTPTDGVYFSLSAVTTVGLGDVSLAREWKLLGPLESLGGMLVFGLSTAFLFAVLQREGAWIRSRESSPD